MRGFGKGFVYLNGHNLGKYWEIGPTQTIYVPAGWLKKGTNEVVVFDGLKSSHTELKILDKPVLDEVHKDLQ
jgi:beta-galactosidase